MIVSTPICVKALNSKARNDLFSATEVFHSWLINKYSFCQHHLKVQYNSPFLKAFYFWLIRKDVQFSLSYKFLG